jgi:membrane associated rhomboid family serine protease
MQNSEKENSEWILKKIIVRVFAYLFCVFLILIGVYKLKNPPYIGTDLFKSIGGIVAACVYLFVDIRILIKKNKRPNS